VRPGSVLERLRARLLELLPEGLRRRIKPFRSWTLRTKLVASMLVLFTALSLLTSALTVFALDRYLTGEMDKQLAASVQRPPRLAEDLGDSSEERRGPGSEGLVALVGDANGGWATAESNTRVRLTTDQLELLQAVEPGSEAIDVSLGGDVGSYRVMGKAYTIVPATGVAREVTYVVGLETEPRDRTIATMTLLAVTGVGAGVVLVGGLGTWLVRRNLAPLRRVAATATRVSQLPLHTGQVALAERVPVEDTDRSTEVGQVGAAFNEMLDHVNDALNVRHQSEQRVRQFVADASHELRTPLASIKGYAELSKREPEPVPSSVNHAMDRIQSEAGRMSALVEDLLLLARLDAGRPLDRTPVDLSMLVVDAVSDAHAAAPEHRWSLDLPPDPIEVTGDRARLHQIVANLLANARTHTPAGTTVTTSVRAENGAVRIAVHDNGPGVPENLRANVFERFARGDDARTRAGGSTGLGLSIVSAVTKAHGGRVELDSRPGDTTFSLVLPANPA
jgi:two-component system OmpR family sensor kinase